MMHMFFLTFWLCHDTFQSNLHKLANDTLMLEKIFRAQLLVTALKFTLFEKSEKIFNLVP